MRIRRVLKWLLVVALVAVSSLVASAPAMALCAVCYTTAAAQGADGIQALNLGIVVLLIPPLAIFSGLLIYAFRYRNSYPSWEKRAWNDRELEDRFLALSACQSDDASSN